MHLLFAMVPFHSVHFMFHVNVSVELLLLIYDPVQTAYGGNENSKLWQNIMCDQFARVKNVRMVCMHVLIHKETQAIIVQECV